MASGLIQHGTAASVAKPAMISLHRPIICYRVEKQRHEQVRTLWWWSRHGTWTTSSEETMEDRMQKYQKIMRYRYSRALRRRAIWERDNSPPSWAVRSPSKWLRAWAYKPISTTGDMQAKLKDETPGITQDERTWESAQRDFEAFKAEIDRAIAKDPVGFLFGRRLQGPLSSNNSSWTSFSRIFDSKESQETFEADSAARSSPKRIKIDDLDKQKTKSNSTTATGIQPGVAQTPHRSEEEAGYVYDPITGRNVPAIEKEPHVSKSFTERLLGGLFSEHREDESHTSIPSKIGPRVAPPSKSENSRKREFQQLRAATLGNSIGTTSEYGGKFQAEADVKTINTGDHDQVESDIPDEAPPFTGTVYGSKSSTGLSSSPRNKLWLRNEGFQDGKLEATRDGSTEKLQPSFDRMRMDGQSMEKKFTTKLQPAVDRINPVKSGSDIKRHAPPLHVVNRDNQRTLQQQQQPESDIDRREDLDLLRSSDVRAGTRVARVTKDQIDRAKSEARQQLEEDFKQRGNREAGNYPAQALPKIRTSTALSKPNVDSITQHVQSYPQGIVAKTLSAMNTYNDKHNSYSRTNVSKVNMTEKVASDNNAPSHLPSLHRGEFGDLATKVSDIPSEKVKVTEKAKEDITKAVRTFNAETKANALISSQHIGDLAKSLREVYESEMGSIDLQQERYSISSSGKGNTSAQDSHPLKTASVKPGVPRYPHIERHTQEFEPTLAAIRDEAKGIKRNLYEVSLLLKTMDNSRKSDNNIGSGAAEVDHKPEITGAACSTDGSRRQLASDEKQRLNAMRSLNDKIKREPHLLEKRVLSPQRVELTPPTDATSILKSSSSTKSTSTPIAPYVIITYNRNTGDVKATELDSLIGQEAANTEKVNPIVVMSTLNYPAAFVTHFARLEKSGYSLVNGGGDILIFQKYAMQTNSDQMRDNALTSIKAIKSDIKEIRNKIAEEEARNQPDIDLDQNRSKVAATVMDDIPVPFPSREPDTPAAPSAGPLLNDDLDHNESRKRKGREARKVRRQEQVFTGTLRPSASHPGSRAGHEHEPAASSSTINGRSVFRRLARLIRQILLTTVGLGVGAYTIGVVSEGIGAHAQIARGAAGSANDLGPRKRIVMPQAHGTGAYSTESSRTE